MDDIIKTLLSQPTDVKPMSARLGAGGTAVAFTLVNVVGLAPLCWGFEKPVVACAPAPYEMPYHPHIEAMGTSTSTGTVSFGVSVTW